MELIPLKDMEGFKQWGAYISEKPYVIVYDKQQKEYTASTKTKNGTTIYVLDYGEGTKTLDEAKEAVMAYHRKQLS